MCICERAAKNFSTPTSMGIRHGPRVHNSQAHVGTLMQADHLADLAVAEAAASPRSCSCCCCSCCQVVASCTCCCCKCCCSSCSCCKRSAVARASASVSFMLRLNSAAQQHTTSPLESAHHVRVQGGLQPCFERQLFGTCLLTDAISSGAAATFQPLAITSSAQPLPAWLSTPCFSITCRNTDSTAC